LVLGKKSGLASIKIKTRDLGLDVPDDQHAGLLELVKARAISNQGLVSDEEFAEMVAAMGVAGAGKRPEPLGLGATESPQGL
jgi:hypothetical protein